MKLAVSTCLLGENVRYDGTNKLIPIIRALKQDYEIIAICPETEAGLGVPRPPIHLINTDFGVRAVVLESESIDVTEALKKQAKIWLKQNKDVQGFILKSRSPSCAYKTLDLGNGIFTEMLTQANPHIPIIDENNFIIEKSRVSFLKNL